MFDKDGKLKEVDEGEKDTPWTLRKEFFDKNKKTGWNMKIKKFKILLIIKLMFKKNSKKSKN